MASRLVCIIPARYASTRFPGKPLARLGGKPMIQVVYEHVAAACPDKMAVATDDERIAAAVARFGGTAVMTGADLHSGTDRCAQAGALMHLDDNDVVLNVQGDEPLVSPKEIGLLKDMLGRPEVEIATLARPAGEHEDVAGPDKVKVVMSLSQKALYFSRCAIPFDRTGAATTRLIHVGMYAYRFGILKALACLRPSPLEETEKLEQLRWMQNGYDIHVTPCDYRGIGIDTPEDLRELLKRKNDF